MRSMLFAVLAVAVCAAVLLSQAIPERLQKTLNLDAPTPFVVAQGDHLRAVNRRLAESGLTDDAQSMYWLARYQGRAGQIKAGEYLLNPGMTLDDTLDMLVRGEVVQHAFTVIEGWTAAQLRSALAADARLIDDTAGLSADELVQQLGIDAGHIEGQFLPETYFFTAGSTVSALLRRAHAALNSALEDAWQDRAEALPLSSPYEALIMASIIEKETGQASERRTISGVFNRRLVKGMRLQTDPTVIYGIGPEFDGDIRRRDLVTDTPYNTYTRHGLPPTPIALAGRASIDAAVDPEDGEALFFVSRGDGSHVFSKTLADHEAAVRQYQLKR